MRAFTLAVFLALTVTVPAGSPAPPAARVDFRADIQPILKRKCQPCHFTGGKMYERLPFDRPETILKLGTKLFTRIKDEEQRAIIRRFLAENQS